MAEFSIREMEGMRQIRIDISNETVRARRGALSNMRGNIQLVPRPPSPRDLFRSLFTSEARIRPYYTGTGSILLQPSLGGYHILTVCKDERWILEPKVYWASDGDVRLGLLLERVGPSLWSGDGLLVWKTTVSNQGHVAINAPGPVEMVEIKNGDLSVQGRLVLGRTDGLQFYSRRSAPFPLDLLAGQRRLRVYSGTGKALVCWTPYWNQYMYQTMTGETIERSLLE
jgi:uncharacterized protein (AIM24 family)